MRYGNRPRSAGGMMNENRPRSAGGMMNENRPHSPQPFPTQTRKEA